MQVCEELRGRIFEIQRFSVHDGSGIRTNVFLQGCPLRCLWCQNPEGQSAEHDIVWSESRCIHCGICSGEVPWAHGRPLTRSARANWDDILDLCPSGALQRCGRFCTVDEVMQTVRRDLPFYRYGGGVTLTGGDPLQQADFASALLTQCRAEGIRTAMETAAALPWDVLAPLLPNLDEIFVDLKLVDTDAARRYTGRGSETVKSNLCRLLSGNSSVSVTVRTPLIPGITATLDNIQQAAAFLAAQNPEIPWELLNYNTLAPAKYALAGIRYPLDESLPAFSADEMANFAETARSNGMRRVFWEGGGTS